VVADYLHYRSTVNPWPIVTSAPTRANRMDSVLSFSGGDAGHHSVPVSRGRPAGAVCCELPWLPYGYGALLRLGHAGAGQPEECGVDQRAAYIGDVDHADQASVADDRQVPKRPAVIILAASRTLVVVLTTVR